MSSASGVEAFLAAKWKSKKMEMENTYNPDAPDSDSEDEQNSEVSPSNRPPLAPRAPNQTDQNIFPTEGNESKFQSEPRPTNIPNKENCPVKDNEVLIPLLENPNSPRKRFTKKTNDDEFQALSPTTKGNDGFMVTTREDCGATRAQPGDGEIPDDSDEGTITEMRPVNSTKVGYYETTGDVWGLLEQQNDDNEQDEEESEFSMQKPKNSRNMDMMFGAISSEDAGKINRERGPKNNQDATLEVPKMVIPFINFGRLLEGSGREDRVSNELERRAFSSPSTSTLKELLSTTPNTTPELNAQVRMTNPFTQAEYPGGQAHITAASSGEKMEDAIRRVMYPYTHNPGSKTVETEADSTTFKPNLENYGTNPTIIETNLNQRLLLPKPTKKRAIAGVRPTVYSKNYDPELGPMDSKNTQYWKPQQNDVIPISRFKVSIDSFSKTLVYNVLKYFEGRKSEFNLPYNEVRMTSEATGMAKSTIHKIMTEAKETIMDNGKPAFCDSRYRKIQKMKFSELNVKRDCIARMFIHNSYLIKKEVPTLKNIIRNCQENGFEKVLGTSAHCVRENLKKLGFEYNASSGKKKFLIERSDFIAQRVRYLEEMQELREQKRNIVFVFVTDLLKRGTKNVEWEGWDGVFRVGEKGVDLTCVTVLHAASNAYVFHDCLQVIEYEVNSETGLLQTPIIEWLKQKLLPKVPKDSVVVLGDQRFNQTADNEDRPHVGCTKEEIAAWLRQHNVEPGDESRPKAFLLEKVQKVLLDQKYLIDDEIKAQGLIPVHTPTHHRDLNPLSFIWQDIKDQLDKADVPSLRFLRNFVKDGFGKAAIKLSKAWSQVQKLEKSYYNIDMHTDAEREELISQYGDGLVPTDTGNESCSDDDEPENEEPPNKKAHVFNLKEI